MLIPIQPLKEAELPERKKPILRMVGPGVVMAGLAIGSGELIMWPWITSVVGAQLLWAAAIGIFLQLWVNIEIGRWTIATGESPFTGMARVVKFVVYLFVFVIFVGKFLPGWARETGIALRDLIFGPQHDSPPWVWTAIVFGLVAAILFGPKVIYTAVERCIMGLIVVIVVGLIYVVWEIGSVEIFVAMWNGVVNVFSFPDFPVDILADDGSVRDQLTFNRFFGAVVFAGAGGLGNLYYAYYLREKDIGMGARMPSLMSPVHRHETNEMDTGYVYAETPENRRRFKDWFRYVVIDQTLFFWLLGSFTMFLFIFGALAVLHPIGLVPDRASLVWDLASILEQSMGTFGRYLFLIVGMAALFSTHLRPRTGTQRSFAQAAPHHSSGYQAPGVCQYTRLDRILDVVECLLGPNLRFHNNKLNMKNPSHGAAVEWHQDWAFYPHTNDDLLEVGIALDDMTEENDRVGCRRSSARTRPRSECNLSVNICAAQGIQRGFASDRRGSVAPTARIWPREKLGSTVRMASPNTLPQLPFEAHAAHLFF